MEYIRGTLRDPDFRDALAVMDSSFRTQQGPEKLSFVKYDLAVMQTVEFLLAVLEATSTLAGLHSLKATEVAANLLSSLRLRPPLPRSFYETNLLNYGLIIVVSGLGLLTMANSERKIFCSSES